MSNPAKNTSDRPMLNTMEDDYIAIRYRPKLSEKYLLCLKINGILNPTSCMFCKADEFYQSTYIQVLENRLEWNFPGLGSCFKLHDNFGGMYYDDIVVDKVDRLGCCKPIPCTTGPCPTYFDICGEGVIIYRRKCCGCGIFRFFRFLEDGDSLKEEIKAAIKARKDNGGAPAPAQMK